MTKVSIFILCYNESVLIKDTIIHYKRLHPSCSITIYDNYSTDDSVKIAKEMGCKVIQWDRGKILSGEYRAHLRNNCWKDVKDGWIIVCDMDEWVYITDEEFNEEEKKGTTIIKTHAYDIFIPESNSEKLEGINLQKTSYGISYFECSPTKSLCFRPVFENIFYSGGSHFCNPVPKHLVKFNKKKYYHKHLSYLSLAFFRTKMLKNFYRTVEDRAIGSSIHYYNEELKIVNKYNSLLRFAFNLDHIFKRYHDMF